MCVCVCVCSAVAHIEIHFEGVLIKYYLINIILSLLYFNNYIDIKHQSNIQIKLKDKI